MNLAEPRTPGIVIGRVQLVLAIAVFLVAGMWLAARHESNSDGTVAPDRAFRELARGVPFRLHQPRLDDSYRVVTAGHLTPSIVSLEYTSSHGAFFTLTEGRQHHPSMTRAFGAGHGVGQVTLNGAVWHMYRSDDPLLLRTFPDGVTVIVRGPPFATLERVAATIT
jgi:Protein of unknown function (DUF4245)